MHTSISRLRKAGFIEGMSLLTLLLIAMPLKYFADIPMAVTIVGSLHGALFVIYMLILAYVTFKVRWHLKWSIAGFLRRSFLSATSPMIRCSASMIQKLNQKGLKRNSF